MENRRACEDNFELSITYTWLFDCIYKGGVLKSSPLVLVVSFDWLNSALLLRALSFPYLIDLRSLTR